VFDAAMLVALPQFGREQLLATLLVFRVLYFVIPFTLAISIMGVREFWMSALVPWQRRRRADNSRPAPPTASSTPAPATATVSQPVQRRKAQG
jgi:hypothetical protein